MSYKFDLISDLHIDFWVKVNEPLHKAEKKLSNFVKGLLPSTPSKILVIAGDLGHYNQQNLLMLKCFKEVYEYVILTWGNHDLYLDGSRSRKKYIRSINRWNEMKELISSLSGVFVLDGETITVDNVTFGGTGMWYDYQYGIQVLNMTREEVHTYWEDNFSDFKYIKGGQPRFADELVKFENLMVSPLDVLITHVTPDWTPLIGTYKDERDIAIYSFDGASFIDRVNFKVCCFGHTHVHHDYVKQGCRFVNNALGYPDQGKGRKIRTIVIPS
jgi:predicted phosphodiesterase